MPREHKAKGRRSVPILVHRIWKKIAEEMDVKEKGKKSTPRQTCNIRFRRCVFNSRLPFTKS